MKKKLLLLSFIEGAAVMAAELCGAKLLAPIFGSSLYVWASVLAITLAALAFGYFFGGQITEKKNPSRSLYLILILASAFLLLMPVISYYVVPRISYLSFIPAVIISTVSLLFFPVFFLGASSPLFIFLQTKDNLTAGKVSGTVYAISTAGGILATFLCGFYAIPELGLKMTLVIFGSILFIATLIFLKHKKIVHTILFSGIIFLNLQFTAAYSSAIFSSESILGRLEVQDVKTEGKDLRFLKINNIIQTEMNLASKKSVSEYVSLLDSITPQAMLDEKALVLGLGGGLTANLFRSKHYSVIGVEFDSRITDCAKNFFYLDPEVASINQDARFFINHCEEKFDLILADVFKAEEQPSHVLTAESLLKIKSMLTDSGLFFVNWHGYTRGELGKGTSILFNTLKTAGFFVEMISHSSDENQRNVIFVVSRNSHLKVSRYKIHDTLPHIGLVNTDDHPLLEKYNAKANKLWRNNYLRYYQGK
jgi:spermidine synthase